MLSNYVPATFRKLLKIPSTLESVGPLRLGTLYVYNQI